MGSGRHGGRATVEGCRSLKLEVNYVTRIVRDGLRDLGDGEQLRAGPITFSWTSAGEREPWARVLVTLTMNRWHGTARLQFDVDHWSRRTGPQDQTVRMKATPCRYGGRRWWWVCPATGRTCATLYLPNGGTHFLSRGPGAYRLAYASQNGSDMDRSHGRLARLHQKLGGAYRFSDQLLPKRPKGMRHRTYDRIWAEWEAAQEQHELIWLAGAAGILRREEKLRR